MSKSWQMLIVFGFILLALYTGFEIFNSLTGGNVTFNQEITPIETDLGQDVLDHINLSIDQLEYKGDVNSSEEFQDFQTEDNQ